MKPLTGLYAWLERLAAGRAAWLLVLTAALVIRLAVVETASPEMLWTDGRTYEKIGWLVAHEGRYGDETLYPPAYPTLIGAVYSVAGRNLHTLRVVEAVLATVTVGLVGAIGGWMFVPAVGLLAAIVAALHPVFSLLPVTHYVENLLVFLSVLAFGSFVWAMRRPSLARFALSGLAFALFALCKPNTVAFMPGLAIGAIWQLQQRRIAPWTYALVFVLAFAAGLAPWLTRNRIEHGRWYLVSSGSGAAFWRGNGPLATGATKWYGVPSPALAESLYRARDPVERDAIYYRDAQRAMLADPVRVAQLYVIKLGNLWALWPNTQTDTPYRNVRANTVMGLCSAFLYIGALLSLRHIRRWRLGYLGLAIITFSLMNAIVLMVMRYRMSFEVLLVWLAAAGWLSLARPDLMPRNDEAAPD